MTGWSSTSSTAPLEPPPEHLDLVVAARVADRDPHEEAVELRLRQRIRPLVLDRVLRREDEKRRREQMRRVLDRDLPLLHRLEQRGLRLRRGAVDLVGKEKIGEDRAGPEHEVRRPLVEDLRAGDVARHEIRRELDARELERRRLREGARDEGLREPGVVLDEHVPSLRSASRMSSSGSRFPTMAFSTSARICSERSRSSVSPVTGSPTG